MWNNSRIGRRAMAAAVVALAGWKSGGATGGVPDYDFEWATITDVGNLAYPGGPNGFNAGRGSVAHEYRVSRTEIRAEQWLEFVNTFSVFGDPFSFAVVTSLITLDPSNPLPGDQYKLAPNFGDNPENALVVDIPWRNAARYANWLHNDKAPTLEALETGAYDTSTWGNDGLIILDDEAHLPGAKFWIPTLDEWLKAVHYDPNKEGMGQGGWWEYPNSSDEPLISGPPGEGQTAAGLDNDDITSALFRIGIFPDVQTPWGLLDASGGGSEWLEGFGNDVQPTNRMFDGAPLGDPEFVVLDTAYQSAAGSFTALSLRLASAVPGPSGLIPPALLLLALSRRTRLD